MMREATMDVINRDLDQKQAQFDTILKHNILQIEDRMMMMASRKSFTASYFNSAFLDNNGATRLALEVAKYFEDKHYTVTQRGFWMQFSWEPK